MMVISYSEPVVMPVLDHPVTETESYNSLTLALQALGDPQTAPRQAVLGLFRRHLTRIQAG